MTVIRLDIISELSFFRNSIKVAVRPKNIALIPPIIKIFICENLVFLGNKKEGRNPPLIIHLTINL